MEQSRLLILQYLGCSAFALTCPSGETLAIDLWTPNAFPYAEDVPADAGVGDGSGLVGLLVSHDHEDHCFLPPGVAVTWGVQQGQVVDEQAVLRLPELTVSKYASEHFPRPWGIEPTANAIFVFEYHGVRICHLADAFGTILDQTGLQDLRHRLGRVDLLLLPIDNPNLQPIDPSRLWSVIDSLAPAAVVPMHYFRLAHKQDFLQAARQAGLPVNELTDNRLEIPAAGLTRGDRSRVISLPAGQLQPV